MSKMNEFTVKAENALKEAYKAAHMLGSESVGSEHLLMGLIREGTGVAARVLSDAGVTEHSVVGLTNKFVSQSGNALVKDRMKYTPSARRIVEQSSAEAERFGSDMIGTEHILIALIKSSDSVAVRILNTLSVNIQKLYADIIHTIGEDIPEIRDQIKGLSTSQSTTPTLDSCSRDLTLLASQGLLDPVIGRHDEIMRVIKILMRRTKNNPCLVGDPGVGKTAIVEGISELIAGGAAPAAIAGKRLVSLDVGNIVAGTKYRGEFEERIKKIISEVHEDGNIILFIDELHTIIGAGSAEGTLDAANILKPALSRGELQVIGATTMDEFRKYIEKDAALERRFQPVTVDEPSEEESIEILKGLRPKFEDYHEVTISDEALTAAVGMSIRYINDRRLPDKAIDLIDEAAAGLRLKAADTPGGILKIQKELDKLKADKEIFILSGDYSAASETADKESKLNNKLSRLMTRLDKDKSEHRPEVSKDDIAETVSLWTRIPVTRLTDEEAERIRNLENTLHKRIISQNDAVEAVAKAIRRGSAGIKSPNRPLGSFLFLGPTGVGKTELSKALAAAVFGSEDALIRVDMSEYMEKHSVSRLIGSPPGYVGFDEGGQLAISVRRNPYSVVLFDEIEKAHPDVFNILLQALDDGFITDSQGRKADFKNTIIIMTSNAGAERIMSPKVMGFASQDDAEYNYQIMKDKVLEEVKRIFRPEFINRLDDIIVFRALTRDDIGAIVDIMLGEFGERLRKQRNITLTVSGPVRDMLIEKGYDPKFGARPLRRTIQSLIEDRMADEILRGGIGDNDKVSVELGSGDSIVIHRKAGRKARARAT